MFQKILIININENSNDNKNEQFILGNPANNDKNVLQSSGDYNTPRKKINTIMDTLQISESLVIKAQPKMNESQQIKDFVNDKRESKSIQYKKYYPKVYDIKKTDINIEKLSEKEELKNSTKLERENIISKNLKNSNNKVYNIVYKHEEYLVLKLYESLKQQFNLLNEDVLKAFSNKDSKNIKLLSVDDFMSILQNNLKLNLSKPNLSLLLNSLEKQDNQNSLFSYEEFIDNIKNLFDKNKEKIEAIFNLALIFYIIK